MAELEAGQKKNRLPKTQLNGYGTGLAIVPSRRAGKARNGRQDPDRSAASS